MNKWKSTYFCVKCKKELTSRDRVCNDGRCPLCSHKNKFSNIVCETYERGRKKIRIKPWWMLWKFWTPTYKIEWKDDS